MCKSIIEKVLWYGKEFPDKLAVADGKRGYTYSELTSAITKMVTILENYMISNGKYVLVECTQDAEFLIFDLACEYIGAVFVPLEKNASQERVSDIYEEMNAHCIIAENNYEEVGRYYSVKEVLMQMEGMTGRELCYTQKNDIAEILYTTGTTGQPKGIVISHQANVAIAQNIQHGVKMHAASVELIPLPLSHSHALRTSYANLYNGSAIVIADGAMNISALFSLIDTYGVNAIDISPTMAKLLLKIAKKGLEKYADTIEYIELGTSVLEDETKKQLKSIFPQTRLYNFYGSTEAGRSCVLDFQEYDCTGCIGYPSANSEIFIVDEERQVINSNANNLGLLAIKGKMMMHCYFNSEELTKATLEEGVLYTNDLGYIDEVGRVYVMGRKDDVINYKGIKIAPEEIEGIAIKYAEIVDCACVPVKDVICGQAPKLFVQVENETKYNEKLFLDYLKERLEPSRVPVAIEVISEVPRSSNGKIQRKKLTMG
jgi:acyl-coenzyme A synthetase/AMP-(fatty) acid ligase